MAKSSLVINILEAHKLREAGGGKTKIDAAVLKSGGDGPTPPGMESRVARLESDMGHAKDSLKSIDSRLEAVRGQIGALQIDAATMKGDIKHLPSKGFVVTATTTSIGILTAIIIFGDKIRGLLGL